MSPIDARTADAVATLAREGGITLIPPEISLDTLLADVEAQLGFPLPLGLILDPSLEGALQEAIKLGSAYFGENLLASISAGMVFPGVGNVIAAAVAIIMFIVETWGVAPSVPPRAYECKSGVWVGDPSSGYGHVNTPVEIMADAQIELLVALDARRKGRGKDYATGTLRQCITNKRTIIRTVAPYVYGTAETSTLPEVDATLVGRIEGGVNRSWASFTHRSSAWGGLSTHTLGVADIPLEAESQRVVQEYENRREYLLGIGDRVQHLAELDTNEVRQLIVDLKREFGIAVVAVERSPVHSSGAPSLARKQNLEQVGLAGVSLVQALRRLQQDAKDYAEKTGGVGVQSLEEQVSKFQREERGGAAPSGGAFAPKVRAQASATAQQFYSQFMFTPTPSIPVIPPGGHLPPKVGVPSLFSAFMRAVVPGYQPRARQAGVRRLIRRTTV